MPLTLEPIVRINYTIVDKDNNASRVGFLFPSTMDNADILTAATELATRLDAISTGVLKGYSITTEYADDTLSFANAAEDSDIERKGFFSFETTNGFRTSFSVPSFDNLLVIDGTNTINTSNALVTAFIDSVINTSLGAGNSPVTARGEDIARIAAPPVKKHRGNEEG